MFQHTVSLRWNSYFCLEWSCFPWILSSPTCLSEHFTQVSGWENNLKNKWLRQTLGTQNVIKNKDNITRSFGDTQSQGIFHGKGKGKIVVSCYSLFIKNSWQERKHLIQHKCTLGANAKTQRAWDLRFDMAHQIFDYNSKERETDRQRNRDRDRET